MSCNHLRAGLRTRALWQLRNAHRLAVLGGACLLLSCGGSAPKPSSAPAASVSIVVLPMPTSPPTAQPIVAAKRQAPTSLRAGREGSEAPEVVRAARRELRSCYQHSKAFTERERQGLSLMATVTVDQSGSVTKVELRPTGSSTLDADFSTCLTAALERLQFSEVTNEEPTLMAIPFRFVPSDDK
jgi:hypothetical protein